MVGQPLHSKVVRFWGVARLGVPDKQWLDIWTIGLPQATPGLGSNEEAGQDETAASALSLSAP